MSAGSGIAPASISSMCRSQSSRGRETSASSGQSVMLSQSIACRVSLRQPQEHDPRREAARGLPHLP
jgi:hypothetical protein